MTSGEDELLALCCVMCFTVLTTDIQ